MPQFLLSHRWDWGTTAELGVHTLAVDTALTDFQDVAEAANTSWGAATDTSSPVTEWPTQVRYSSLWANEILDLSTGTLAAGWQTTLTTNGSGTQVSPPQMAVAVSIEAGRYAHNNAIVRGRFYLPPVKGTSIVTPGVVAPAAITVFGNFIRDYLTNLAAAGLLPVVWSRKFAFVAPLTAVRIGNVADTIRSRRNALDEAYTTVSYPA